MIRRLPSSRLLLILLLILPLAVVGGMVLGPQIILPFQTGDSAAVISDLLIVQQIRLPRVLMAGLIGATLALAGVVMQGLFRNPLADPSLIGVSAGASAGASLIIVMGGSLFGVAEWAGVSLLVIGAFAGAAAATWLVYRLAASATGTSVATMLLAGIAISSLAGAINHLLQLFADNHMLRLISLWQMGSLSGVSWSRLGWAALLLVPALAFFPRYAIALNAFLLGESQARHLGVEVDVMKRQVIILVAFTVAVAVSLTGTISFVGLMTPHLVRMIIGPDHRGLIPCSALAGAVLLIFADAFSRYLLAPGELPIGVVTAMLGAPFFLSLLRRQRRVVEMSS